jgi:hypothetical protein
MNIFEDSSTPISLVLPTLDKLCSQLIELKSQNEFAEFHTTIDCIVHKIEERFHKTARIDILISAFAFTYKGRRERRILAARPPMSITKELSDDECSQNIQRAPKNFDLCSPEVDSDTECETDVQNDSDDQINAEDSEYE